MNKLNKNECFALGQFLCKWPENMAFDDILESLKDDDENVVIWSEFEDMPAYELARNINDTKEHTIYVFGLQNY